MNRDGLRRTKISGLATYVPPKLLTNKDLEAMVEGERVKRVVLAEGIVAPGAEWLTEFWAGGRSRAWVLAQMALLHPFGHYYEARVAAGLWGVRSP